MLLIVNKGAMFMALNAVSLFFSSGIGDLGLKANNIKTVIGCEIIEERMKLFQANYPDAKCFLGDIWKLKDDIIDYSSLQLQAASSKRETIHFNAS